MTSKILILAIAITMFVFLDTCEGYRGDFYGEGGYGGFGGWGRYGGYRHRGGYYNRYRGGDFYGRHRGGYYGGRYRHRFDRDIGILRSIYFNRHLISNFNSYYLSIIKEQNNVNTVRCSISPENNMITCKR